MAGRAVNKKKPAKKNATKKPAKKGAKKKSVKKPAKKGTKKKPAKKVVKKPPVKAPPAPTERAQPSRGPAAKLDASVPEEVQGWYAQLKQQYLALVGGRATDDFAPELKIMFHIGNAIFDHIHGVVGEGKPGNGWDYLDRAIKHFAKNPQNLTDVERGFITGDNGFLATVPVDLYGRGERKFFIRDWALNFLLVWTYVYGYNAGKAAR